jgi:hypothetical protein
MYGTVSQSGAQGEDTMQFESRQKRSIWLAATVATIPDLLIAAVIAVLMDGGILGFFAAFIGLQVLYFAIWLKNSIWGWTWFQWWGRKHAAQVLLDYLKQHKFPQPATYQKSADGYLAQVAGDEGLPMMLRLIAARELGAFQIAASEGEFQKHMRISMAYEDAITMYQAQFPPHGAIEIPA